jgi:hypothetical protein
MFDIECCTPLPILEYSAAYSPTGAHQTGVTAGVRLTGAGGGGWGSCKDHHLPLNVVPSQQDGLHSFSRLCFME